MRTKTTIYFPDENEYKLFKSILNEKGVTLSKLIRRVLELLVIGDERVLDIVEEIKNN